MQVKLYADDGRRIWDNNYTVNLPLETAIKVVDEELNTKLGSNTISNAKRALNRISSRVSTVELKNGHSVTVERRIRN